MNFFKGSDFELSPGDRLATPDHLSEIISAMANQKLEKYFCLHPPQKIKMYNYIAQGPYYQCECGKVMKPKTFEEL